MALSCGADTTLRARSEREKTFEADRTDQGSVEGQSERQ